MASSRQIRPTPWIAILAAWLTLSLSPLPCRAFDDPAQQPVEASSELPAPQTADPLMSAGPTFDPLMTFAEEEPPILAPQPRRAGRGSNVRLIDRVTDPTESLQQYRLRESWNRPLQDNDDNQQFEFRPTIPFELWDYVHILRVTMPYNISGDDGAGLEEVRVLDLIAFQESWGRWGVGPVLQFTPAGGADHNTFQIGPAAGTVAKDQHWTVGILAQNFLADEVAESILQPILAYKFDDQWALDVGEFEFRYDWEAAEWTQVPLGLQLEYIADIHGEKIQFFVNPQYNLISDASNGGWTIYFGLSLLVPDA